MWRDSSPLIITTVNNLGSSYLNSINIIKSLFFYCKRKQKLKLIGCMGEYVEI